MQDAKKLLRKENTVKSEKIYEGRILNLRVDTVELPNMKYGKREIVEHPRGVAMIPVAKDGTIFMVKQFRKAVEKELLELPAGIVEVSEEPREAAQRELQEEIGYKSEKLTYLFDAYVSPGFTDEKLSIFLAEDLVPSKLEEDDDENLDVCQYTLDELVRLVDDCEIVDAKTIIGILYLKSIRSSS